MGDHAAGRGSDDTRDQGRVVTGQLRLYVVYLLVGHKSPQRREYRERLQGRFRGAPGLPRVGLGQVRHVSVCGSCVHAFELRDPSYELLEPESLGRLGSGGQQVP